MVSIQGILSFPSNFLSSTANVKVNYALPIFLTNEWFKYFDYAPFEGFTKLATEAKTVMGFVSGIEFLRDLGKNYGDFIKPKNTLSMVATAASSTKKFIKFMGFLKTKQIFQFSRMDSYNKAEPFFGTLAGTIKCYQELNKFNDGNSDKKIAGAAVIQSGAFAIFDGLSFLEEMGWTRDFRAAKLCASTIGVAATFFQVGYNHNFSV